MPSPVIEQKFHNEEAGAPITHCWPRPAGKALSIDQRIAAMRSFLTSAGLDASDFEIELKPQSWLTGMLGIGDRFLAVRRRSSRRERIYSAELHTPWMAELLNDLEHGEFA